MARYMSQDRRSGRLFVFFTAARLKILGHNLPELFPDRHSAVDRHGVAKLLEVPRKDPLFHRDTLDTFDLVPRCDMRFFVREKELLVQFFPVT